MFIILQVKNNITKVKIKRFDLNWSNKFGINTFVMVTLFYSILMRESLDKFH